MKEWKNRIVGYGMIDPNTVNLNPLNFRDHPDNQRDMMDSILDEVGWVQGVIINKTTGNLIDGQMRVEEAIEKGELEVPFAYVELTPEEERKVLLTFNPVATFYKDNQDKLKELVELTSIQNDNMQEIVDRLAKKNKLDFESESGYQENFSAEDNDAQILAKEWKIENGQLWKIGNSFIMCGDSCNKDDISKLVKNNKMSMGFFDPPYAIGFRSNSRKATNKFEVLQNDDKFLVDWIPLSLDYMKPDFAYYICTRWDVYSEWFNIVKEFINVKDLIVLAKQGGGMGDLEGTYSPSHEFMLFCHNGNHKIRGIRESNIWEFDKVNVSSYIHPTQKPVSLVEKAIKHSSDEGDNILDLFCGSGTTLVACENTRRIGFGMEKDPFYVAVILQRFKNIGFEAELIK